MNALRSRITWARAVLVVLAALLVGLLAVFVAVGVSGPAWVYAFFGVQGGTEKFRILEFVGVGMGGVLLAIGATIAHRRAVAMEDAAKAQTKTAQAQAEAAAQQAAANRGAEDGRRQERLKNAIEHLGHESDSVRLGGAYELFHLARDTGDLRQTAMDILCAHIRRTTGETEYREKHKSKPSEEVQSLLTLLFRQEHEVFTGCRIDLQGGWLKGIDLRQALMQGANLSLAHLQGAIFFRSQMKEAMLMGTHLQGAKLFEAHLQGANLFEAHLQGAELSWVHLQEADLSEAHMQGALLSGAGLQGADLSMANLQGANFFGVRLQGADTSSAQMQGVSCQLSSGLPFEVHIRAGIGRKSDLSKVTFAGGLRQEDVDSLVQGVPGRKANALRQTLEPHIGRPPSHGLPEGSAAIVGAYTAEEAERWIAEYKEATGESPEADTG